MTVTNPSVARFAYTVRVWFRRTAEAHRSSRNFTWISYYADATDAAIDAAIDDTAADFVDGNAGGRVLSAHVVAMHEVTP